MSGPVLYQESLSSQRTTALFIALVLLFGALALWQISTSAQVLLQILFALLACVFLFYVINYQKLIIRITTKELALNFGIFSRTIPIANIRDCRLDNPPWFYKYGGAGIHFYSLGGFYRASFNFLEYPRVVVLLQKKAWIVQEISFSTRRPDKVIGLVQETILTTKKEEDR